MKIKYLFNFSASRGGGGLRRLLEYSRWFNTRGGADFIVHEQTREKVSPFTGNTHHFIKQSNLKRLFKDCDYIPEIIKQIGQPQIYFSYGIPVYSRVGRINWFHLSNLLAVYRKGIPLSLEIRSKMLVVGNRLKRNAGNCDVMSAESENSLNLLAEHTGFSRKRMLKLENGVDGELLEASKKCGESKKKPIMLAIGTYKYKRLRETYEVFSSLKHEKPDLELHIIGDPVEIPPDILKQPGVVSLGIKYGRQNEVYSALQEASYFITNTAAENSSVASLEGVILARESLISDIPPHRELLNECSFRTETFENQRVSMLRVKQTEIADKIQYLSWDEAINEMDTRAKVILAESRPPTP